MPTNLEQPGSPQEPQAPVNPTPTQPGKGDDFTQPRKDNEQARMGRRNPADEPIEKQTMKEDEEAFELEDEDIDYDERPNQTH